MSTEEHYRWMLEERGIEEPCLRCQGFGSVSYASTATWRGGMGGAAITSDVCDKCWGSGDKHRPWTDLRKLQNEENHRVALLAGEMFERRCGAFLRTLLPAIDELVVELDKFERQRRPRPYGFDTVSRALAAWLREVVAAKRLAMAAEETGGG